MMAKEVIQVTPDLRAAADALLVSADGDANAAYSLALENHERDDFESDAEFVFSVDLVFLCHYRANAAFEGFQLIEIVGRDPT